MKKIISAICYMVILSTVLLSLSACGASIQDDWTTVILGEHLPTPQKGKLRSGSNLDDIFMGGIKNVNADYYTEYKNACIEMGYTVESKESGNSYDAFNVESYDLSLSYYGNEIHISLSVPVELDEIKWPTTGLGAKLPVPSSTLAKVNTDSSSSFSVIVGNTGMDGYNDYVKLCEDKGFVEDYSKTDGRYAAKDTEGFRLVVWYDGCNRMGIMIQIPKLEDSTTQTDATNPTEETKETEETQGSNDTIDGLDKEFKEAMDSYERFMDEYVSFMKNYRANPTDISLVTDYASYLKRYADFVEDFENWENAEMSKAETAYYLDVQSRVSKKLLELAQ